MLHIDPSSAHREEMSQDLASLFQRYPVLPRAMTSLLIITMAEQFVVGLVCIQHTDLPIDSLTGYAYLEAL